VNPRIVIIQTTAAIALFSSAGQASEQGPASQNGSPATSESTPEKMIENYCGAIADKASDARIAWQTANLQKLEKEISDKLVLLEGKQKELQQWVEKREQMLKTAGRELVDIYAKMDPEAAAGQLAKLDTATSTSVLRQLSPRGASAILNVMEAERAAELADAIAAATRGKAAGDGT